MAHAAHHGTQMKTFNQYSYTQGVENAFESFGYLVGHPLLHLQPLGVHSYQTRDL